MKYVKKFDTHADYEVFRETEDFIKPNVSFCVDPGEVHLTGHFNIKPNSFVYYSDVDMTDYSYGIMLNRWGNIEPISHSFENGVGTVEFNGNIEQIDRHAIHLSTDLDALVLPSTVQTLEDEFIYNGPSTLVVLAETPPQFTTTPTMFFSAIYVPASSLEAYRNDANWSLISEVFLPADDFDPADLNADGN